MADESQKMEEGNEMMEENNIMEGGVYKQPFFCVGILPSFCLAWSIAKYGFRKSGL